MGLFSFVGGLIGAGAQKKGIKKATKAEVDALNRGIDEEARQYDTSRAGFKPYMDAGTSALPGILNLLGLNGPEAAATAIAALKDSPVYQSLYNNGEEAVLQNASATGGLRGGNTETGLADFGRDTLSSVISDQLARLGGLAGLGEGATGSVASLGANKADAVAALLGKIGSAQASGALAKAGVNAGMWNSAGSFLDQVVSSFMGAGGGPGGASFNLSSFLQGI